MIGIGLGVGGVVGMSPARNPSRFIHGDRSAAAAMLSTDRITHVAIAGDSRMTGYQASLPASGIQVGGLQQPMSFQVDSAGVYDSALSPSPSGDGTHLDALLGIATELVSPSSRLVEVEFLGGTSAATYLQRRWSTVGTDWRLTADNYGADTLSRFNGESATVRCVVYEHAGGLSASSITLAIRRDGQTTPDAESSGFDGYDASGLYSVRSVTHPAHDWSAGNSIELCVSPSVTLANTEQAHVVGHPWVEVAGAGGPLFHNWNVGGASVRRFASESTMPASHWTDVFPLYGDERALLVQLGTNNAYGDDQAAFETYFQQLIDRFRAGTPFGVVVLLTSYAAQSDGGVAPAYVAASKAVAEANSRVLCLDTYNWMPDYTAGSARGYYADTVHYDEAGVSANSAAIRTLLEAAALNSDASFWGTCTGGTTQHSPARTTKTGNTSWNHAVATFQQFIGDFSIDFASEDNGSDILFGITGEESPTTYSDNIVGVHLRSVGDCRWYHGSQAQGAGSTNGSGDVFRFVRSGSTVTLLRDAGGVGSFSLIHTYTIPATGSVRFMIAGYTLGVSGHVRGIAE